MALQTRSNSSNHPTSRNRWTDSLVGGWIVVATGKSLMSEELVQMLEEAYEAYGRGDYNAGISLFQKALSVSVQDQDKATIFEFLGHCYDKKGDDNRAFEFFRKTFSINPDYFNGWYLLYRYAQLAYRFREFRISIEYLRRVLDEIPPDKENYVQYTHRLLGNNYLACNEYRQALNEFKEALRIETNSKWKSYIYGGIAQAYFGLDKTGKAIKSAHKALTEEFDEGLEEKMYFLLAFCYGMRGMHKNKDKEEYYTERLRASFPRSAYLRELEMF